MAFAEKIPVTETLLSEGRVQWTEGNSMLTIGSRGLIKAERAASCLLMPEKGDIVLLSLTESGRAWVLSVLVREGESGELSLPKKTALRTEELNIDAEKASCTSRELTLQASHMSLSSHLLSLGGKVLLQGFSVVRTIAGMVSEHIVRRRSRLGSLSEHIEGLCEHKSQRLRARIEKSLRIRAENADMHAKEQIDLDARHIKIG